MWCLSILSWEKEPVFETLTYSFNMVFASPVPKSVLDLHNLLGSLSFICGASLQLRCCPCRIKKSRGWCFQARNIWWCHNHRAQDFWNFQCHCFKGSTRFTFLACIMSFFTVVQFWNPHRYIEVWNWFSLIVIWEVCCIENINILGSFCF